MSIITGKYFDIPPNDSGYSHYEHGAAASKSAKRRFFQSNPDIEIWEDDVSQVDARVNAHRSISNGFGNGIHDLTGLMENGGAGTDMGSVREEEREDEEDEEEDEDIPMADL